jgi:hypothetical protein
MAYPARAYHMYLCPLAECMSKRFTESLLFRWSKQRTKAKSMEGIACNNNMKKKFYFKIFLDIAEDAISSKKAITFWNSQKKSEAKYVKEHFFLGISILIQYISEILDSDASERQKLKHLKDVIYWAIPCSLKDNNSVESKTFVKMFIIFIPYDNFSTQGKFRKHILSRALMSLLRIALP